jgi:hypothetical protein
MKFNIVISAGLLASGFAFANENTNDQNNQSYDLIQEYFDAAVENNQDNDNNSEADDNRFNRVAESVDGTTASDASGTASSTEGTPADDASKAKKTKKLKKKKKSTTEGEVTASVTSGHGAQESGAPYSANVDLGLTYTSTSTTRKYSDTPLKDTDTELELSLKYLFVLGKFEIGPVIEYQSSSKKSQISSASSTTATTSKIGFGAALNFNLGNIHQDKMVPYAGINVLKLSTASSDKTDALAESKSSLSSLDFGIELGAKYFMGAHFALKPFFSYDMTLSGEDKDDSNGSEIVASVTGSKMSLGLGLATYL